jgi:hypothetical protein
VGLSPERLLGLVQQLLETSDIQENKGAAPLRNQALGFQQFQFSRDDFTTAPILLPSWALSGRRRNRRCVVGRGLESGEVL